MTTITVDKSRENIEGTLYLLSIPGMKESIIEGLNAPIEECLTEIDWSTQQ